MSPTLAPAIPASPADSSEFTFVPVAARLHLFSTAWSGSHIGYVQLHTTGWRTFLQLPSIQTGVPSGKVCGTRDAAARQLLDHFMGS